jgi:NSS family neurotransmitter:Na+ symporter
VAQSSGSLRTSLHGLWSSRLAFVLAVTGSAVGLGNIWRFPYIAGENGGGAFVLVYLVCIFAIGLPVMMAETLLGRRGRRNPVATMQLLGEEEAGTSRWRWVGVVGVVTGILILSFYSVIAGLAVAYIFDAGAGSFGNANAIEIKALYDAHRTNFYTTGLWHTAFMAAAVVIVACGVERGLERAVRVMMPTLVLMLLGLLIYSSIAGEFVEGVKFLFVPRFDELTANGVLEALGHAFFTLSVGMGAIMAYGAYLPSGASITQTSIAVVLADTVIALIAALVIFPIVFANEGLESTAGPGLIFETLPLAFGNMPGGVIVGVVFFLLLAFAAWTSAISLMEPAVAWGIENFGVPRAAAAASIGFITWLIGWLTVLSLGPWENRTFFQGTVFDNLGYLTNNILLPLGGLAIVIFAGWVMARNSTSDELGSGSGFVFQLWEISARYVAPIAITVIMLNAIGVLPRMLAALGLS